MQRKASLVLLCIVALLLVGCTQPDSNLGGPKGTYDIEADWTTIELESKTEYYPDEEDVAWTLESTEFADEIETAGGNVVGILFELSYPNEDESAGFGCTGLENDVQDIIYSSAQKNEWSKDGFDTNPGGHQVNLTWHNNSLLDLGTVSGFTQKEIHDQLAFGENALGTYSLNVTVDARAFDGLTCTHSDDGEEVTTIVSLLVIDFTITQNNTENLDITALGAGDGEISLILFMPWFIGIIALVGFISINRERFQLGMILEEDEEKSTETDFWSASVPKTMTDEIDASSSSEGNSLVENYNSRVLTLCALYVAQGIPWGFMTVTFVTYLALEGVGAGKLALLLTLGTLPWSVKFLWGPVIDKYQYREMGRRRPWILAAQTGMILFLSAILLVPDPASNVLLVSIMFCFYNVFTSLQDVSTDALAVDILRPDEIEQVNSYMFTSKSVGGIIGGAGLGSVINILGIKGAIALQIPILILIMLVPLFMTERPGEKRFPWSESNSKVEEDFAKDGQNFREIFDKIKTALSIKAAQLGILLSLTVSLSFFLIPVLPLLFVRELGWTEEQFNQTKGGIILVVTMIGYLIGGQLGKRLGGKTTIIYAGCWNCGPDDSLGTDRRNVE